MKRSAMTFSEVWNAIIESLSEHKVVNTLVQRVPNDILETRIEGILVRSHKTGIKRIVPRHQFEGVWNSLIKNGKYVSSAHKPYIHSQIICAILSLLSYIEVTFEPLTLHLKGIEE